LVGMGVVPLEYQNGETAESLGLDGSEHFTIHLHDGIRPKETVKVSAKRESGETVEFDTTVRIDSPVEIDYVRNGGILHTVLRRFVGEARSA
ncbi:MAG: hypothetical protein ACOCRN_05615, partial [Spirochaetia bacterium]